jgi:hypothetical protein
MIRPTYLLLDGLRSRLLLRMDLEQHAVTLTQLVPLRVPYTLLEV